MINNCVFFSISDPTENLLKESKGTSWGPINTGVQKGKRSLSGHIVITGTYLFYIHQPTLMNSSPTQHVKGLIMERAK